MFYCFPAGSYQSGYVVSLCRSALAPFSPSSARENRKKALSAVIVSEMWEEKKNTGHKNAINVWGWMTSQRRDDSSSAESERGFCKMLAISHVVMLKSISWKEFDILTGHIISIRTGCCMKLVSQSFARVRSVLQKASHQATQLRLGKSCYLKVLNYFYGDIFSHIWDTWPKHSSEVHRGFHRRTPVSHEGAACSNEHQTDKTRIAQMGFLVLMSTFIDKSFWID